METTHRAFHPAWIAVPVACGLLAAGLLGVTAVRMSEELVLPDAPAAVADRASA